MGITMADDAAKKVQQYKDTTKKQQAEELINHGFPRKIVELNELLATPLFTTQNLVEVHQDLKVPIPKPHSTFNSHDIPAEAKKRKLDIEDSPALGITLPSGSVPCNMHIREMMKIVKPYIWHLVEDANTLKMWISFLIPKIEDGNNFGVSIQEDMLAEIRSVESEAAAFFDQISRYFITRGKIVTKVTKYPFVEDFSSLSLSLSLSLSHLSNIHPALDNLWSKFFHEKVC